MILFVNDSNAVDLADKLRDQGLQVTAQRIAVTFTATLSMWLLWAVAAALLLGAFLHQRAAYRLHVPVDLVVRLQRRRR